MSNLDSLAVGFVSGIGVTVIGGLVYDYLRSPSLKAYPRAGDPDIQEVAKRRRAFYHIVIKNERSGLIVSPAYNARVTMVFSSREKEQIFRIPAKWDFRPEPLRREVKSGKLIEFPEPSLMPQAELLDISPDSEETFCICMKYEGEKEAYGFNAFSYLHPELKNPSLKLYVGEYQVHIVVNAANAHDEFEFLIRNTGTRFQDLTIEANCVIQKT